MSVCSSLGQGGTYSYLIPGAYQLPHALNICGGMNNPIWSLILQRLNTCPNSHNSAASGQHKNPRLLIPSPWSDFPELISLMCLPHYSALVSVPLSRAAENLPKTWRRRAPGWRTLAAPLSPFPTSAFLLRSMSPQSSKLGPFEEIVPLLGLDQS